MMVSLLCPREKHVTVILFGCNTGDRNVELPAVLVTQTQVDIPCFRITTMIFLTVE